MAFGQITSGTVTTDGTEQTLTTQTTNTRYQALIDLSNMVNGDVIEIRVKTKILTGGSAILQWYSVYQNAQATPFVTTPEINSPFSIAVTIKKTAGANHNYDWSMNEVQRSEPLTPTVAGRTLDVSATGEAGVDWANVGSPTTSVGLTNTTISTTQAVASVSGAVGSVTARVTANTDQIEGLDATNQIRDSILTDATRFPGADIDATISSRLASASYTTPPTATQNADALLNRDMSAVSDTNARTPLNALRLLRNKISIAAGTLTVTKENDVTTAWTAAVTTDAAALPITVVDPP